MPAARDSRPGWPLSAGICAAWPRRCCTSPCWRGWPRDRSTRRSRRPPDWSRANPYRRGVCRNCTCGACWRPGTWPARNASFRPRPTSIRRDLGVTPGPGLLTVGQNAGDDDVTADEADIKAWFNARTGLAARRLVRRRRWPHAQGGRGGPPPPRPRRCCCARCSSRIRAGRSAASAAARSRQQFSTRRSRSPPSSVTAHARCGGTAVRDDRIAPRPVLAGAALGRPGSDAMRRRPGAGSRASAPSGARRWSTPAATPRASRSWGARCTARRSTPTPATPPTRCRCSARPSCSAATPARPPHRSIGRSTSPACTGSRSGRGRCRCAPRSHWRAGNSSARSRCSGRHTRWPGTSTTARAGKVRPPGTRPGGGRHAATSTMR